MDNNAVQSKGLRGWLRFAPWIFAVGCLLAVLPIRLSAHTSDFATANILTVILLMLTWIACSIGLAQSSLPRVVPRLVFWGPLVVLACFFTFYKFERVDGELNPQFQYRWSRERALSNVEQPAGPLAELSQSDADASSTESSIAKDLLAPRPTDYPQFLGPNRNAMLPSQGLDPNWQATPPEILWKQDIGEGWSAFAVQGDVAVTMEQRQSQEWVSAYSVLDGSLLWKFAIEAKHSSVLGGTGPRSTPTIVDNQVIACSAVSQVVCLKLANGAPIWSCDLLEMAGTTQAEFEKEVSWGRAASALVVEDKVFIPLGGVGSKLKTLVALDRASGAEVWRSGDDQISYSSPVLATLAGVVQVLLISETQASAYDLTDGHILWSVPWPGGSSSNASVSQPVVVDDSHVLLTKGYGAGCQYLQVTRQGETWSVKTEWENRSSLRTKFTSCVVKDGFAYGLSDGILECVSLADGKKQWKNGRYRQGQLLLVGEYLLITSERGDLVLVQADPRDFDELAKLPVIGDVSWNTAALSGNRCLMRNSDEAACVILPLKTQAKTEAN